MSLYDMYFSKKNKNYIFNIISDLVLKETGTDINSNPDYVIHLAAISSVENKDISKFKDVNINGTNNLLYLLNKKDMPPKLIILPSSAQVYSPVTEEPLDENSLIGPSNEYGKSKIEMEKLSKKFEKLPILITRPFNYTGVGQDSNFLIPKIVSHFKLKKNEIELGNIDIKREFNVSR